MLAGSEAFNERGDTSSSAEAIGGSGGLGCAQIPQEHVKKANAKNWIGFLFMMFLESLGRNVNAGDEMRVSRYQYFVIPNREIKICGFFALARL